MAEQGDDEDLCAICSVATRGELEAAGVLGVLSCCDHWYCADCILPWLTTRSSTCPTCRQQVDWMAVHAMLCTPCYYTHIGYIHLQDKGAYVNVAGLTAHTGCTCAVFQIGIH